MKNQILMTTLVLFTAVAGYANEGEQRLQSIGTISCDTKDLVRAVKITADTVFLTETGLTVLEEKLEITKDQKSMGQQADITNAEFLSTKKDYTASLNKAYKINQKGGVGITIPASIKLTYNVVKGDTVLSKGEVLSTVTCRVETKKNVQGDDTLKHSMQVTSFEITKDFEEKK